MAVTAGKVREPLAGPGGQVARPRIQLVVRCIPAYCKKCDQTGVVPKCVYNSDSVSSTMKGIAQGSRHIIIGGSSGMGKGAAKYIVEVGFVGIPVLIERHYDRPAARSSFAHAEARNWQRQRSTLGALTVPSPRESSTIPTKCK